jgi:hypothetical protein
MRSTKDEAIYQEKRLEIMTEKHLDKETKQSLLRIDWGLVSRILESNQIILH